MKAIKNQSQLFAHVWETREHISEVSGKTLLHEGHSMWHWQFAHVLGKGTNTRWKLNPDNIMLMLPEEHTNQERFEAFRERQQKLKLAYELESPYSYAKI